MRHKGEGASMKQVEIFRAFSYESLKDLVNNWLQQNNYTIIDTSMSIYATHLNVIFLYVGFV